MTVEPVVLHAARQELVQYPEAWYDPNDRQGIDGHRHEYGFRTLRCRRCKVGATPWQYVNIPGFQNPPIAKGTAIIAIYRADKVHRWLDYQIKATNARIFTSEMFSEYADVIEPEGAVDSEGIWLGGPVDLPGEHAWCAGEFHRCDGGGPGEFNRYER